ncbi:MAG TPA: NAD(P)H-quinone oxidoreductase [Candidatus Binatia bacterium]|jgi:putative PIG3 family NAD(P)H quinone oxidoreductase
MATMRAIRVEGAEQALVLGDAPRPEPAAGQVLIEVHATAVNRADLLQRRGFYPPPPGESDTLGLEAAGTVAALGPDVSGVRVGDRVMCLLGGGGYAEYVVVDHRMALPIPAAMPFEQAAGIPEVFYTAYMTLVAEAGLARGETLLIHAGGSGVGTAAIQLANALGARALVTAGSADKLERCRALGAAGGINYKDEDFAERGRELSDGHGADVILDCVGGSYLERNVGLLAPRGRLVIIGLMGGAKAEINLALLVGKRLRVIGTVLRTRSFEEKLALTAGVRATVLPLLAAGTVRPIIDAEFPLTDAAAAHDRVASNANFGKVILRVRQG